MTVDDTRRIVNEYGVIRGFSQVGEVGRSSMACKGSGVQIPSAPHFRNPLRRRGFRVCDRSVGP